MKISNNRKHTIARKLIMKNFCKQFLILIALAFVATYNSHAQDSIQKVVQVFKAYEPKLCEASKINLLPVIADTGKTMPTFAYQLVPRKMSTNFELRPIQAAKLTAVPFDRYYRSYLRVGFGNYYSPLLEFYFNSLRAESYTYSLSVRHNSSSGDVKLANDEKVYAGFSESEIELNGKYIFSKAAITGNIGYQSHGIHYYGYNPELDTTLDKDDIKQSYNDFNIGTRIYSLNTDSNHFNYLLKLDYNYFADRFNNAENGILVNADVNKMFIAKLIFGLGLDVNYFGVSPSIDSFNNTVIGINPYITKAGGDWQFLLGFNSSIDNYASGKTKFYFYPRAELKFNVVKNVLVPYIGVTGFNETNNYRKIALENKFIVPDLHVTNTNHQFDAYVGMKGKYSSYVNFNVSLSYSWLYDLYLFVNDTSNILANQFTVVYDDAQKTHINGELNIIPSSKLSFALQGNYYYYKMSSEDKPWHLPSFDVTVSAKYNIQDKILIGAEVFGIGSSYAKSLVPDGENIKLDGLLDLNLSVEYNYSKVLSAFVRLNNIAGWRYEQYNQYPGYGFLAMIGFSYKL
jgi:hypothetical protein